jgi:hypothetical protein
MVRVSALSCLLATSNAVASPVECTFFVKQQPSRIAQLEASFHAVSDPDSLSYGEHLQFDAVVELQRPRADHLRSVREHIASVAPGGLVRESLAGDKLVVSVPPAVGLEGLMQLPDSVSEAVDMVTGGGAAVAIQVPSSRNSSAVQSEAQLASADASPYDCLKDAVTPTCLRSAYGLNGTKSTQPQNSQAVIVNQNYLAHDLEIFFKRYKLPGPVPVRNVGKNSGTAGDEASLDLQYIMSTGLGVQTTWVYIDGHADNPFASWLTWASNQSNVPFVHSLSVGEPEGEFGEAVCGRMNQEMMALGARGVSVVFASGDSGYVKEQKFGASSPYVTSVGGVFNGEMGDDFLQPDTESTGGFSSLNANPIQPWQTDAVAHYLTTKGARPSFNSSRRCVPDVAVYDLNYKVIQGGRDTALDGTSCATPVFAGMVSLLNDARFAQGKPPLGFLNYFLYKNQPAFLDLARGGNGGFDAVVGYDPASGLGTFDGQTFGKLLRAAAPSGPTPPTPAPAPPVPTPVAPTPATPTPAPPTPATPTPAPGPPGASFTILRFEADPKYEFVVSGDATAALPSMCSICLHAKTYVLEKTTYTFGTTHCDVKSHIDVSTVAKAGDKFTAGAC